MNQSSILWIVFWWQGHTVTVRFTLRLQIGFVTVVVEKKNILNGQFYPQCSLSVALLGLMVSWFHGLTVSLFQHGFLVHFCGSNHWLGGFVNSSLMFVGLCVCVLVLWSFDAFDNMSTSTGTLESALLRNIQNRMCFLFMSVRHLCFVLVPIFLPVSQLYILDPSPRACLAFLIDYVFYVISLFLSCILIDFSFFYFEVYC